MKRPKLTIDIFSGLIKSTLKICGVTSDSKVSIGCVSVCAEKTGFSGSDCLVSLKRVSVTSFKTQIPVSSNFPETALRMESK